MTDGMLWTERIFSASRLRGRSFISQALIRLVFIALFWAVGAAIYSSDGLLIPYLSTAGIYEGLYLPGLIVLLGSYGVQQSLHRIIDGFKPLLNKEEGDFEAWRGQIEGIFFSFTPCIFIGLIFAVFLSGVPESLANIAARGVQLRYLWDLFTAVFFDLVAGTGVWMFLGIWYIILDVSRQEFHVELLERVSEGFRELMKLTLYYAVFYFITVSVAVALPLLSMESHSWVEVVFSPYLAFVVIGAASVVFPLYSIHSALLNLKRVRMGELREESRMIMIRLDEVTREGADVAGTLSVMARLQAVQLKEGHIQAAPEWPINMDFVGKLAGLIIMPTIVRIFIEIFRGYLPI